MSNKSPYGRCHAKVAVTVTRPGGRAVTSVVTCLAPLRADKSCPDEKHHK